MFEKVQALIAELMGLDKSKITESSDFIRQSGHRPNADRNGKRIRSRIRRRRNAQYQNRGRRGRIPEKERKII